MAGGRSELLITRLRDLTRDVLKCPLSMRARVSESFLRSAREARRSGNLIRLTSGSSSRSTRTVLTMLIGRNLHNATQLNLEGWPASEPELLTWWIPRVARYNVESSKYDGTSRVAPTASNERLGMRLNRSAQSGTT